MLSAADYVHGAPPLAPCTSLEQYGPHAHVVDYYGGSFYNGLDVPPVEPLPMAVTPGEYRAHPGGCSTWPRQARGPRTWPEGDTARL